MRTPLIFDGRNLIDPAAAASYGFQYRGIGRGAGVETTAAESL
jgi:UDPglucose 6-dehydrogenase